MNTVQLGKSGVEVSALALGTDLFGTKIDRDTCFGLLDYFAEHGGTFLDTANFYASWLPGCKGGESETTIGEWIKSRNNRDRVAIGTKLAFDYPGCAGGLSAGEIQRECDKSLRRLQTDRIDLYYSHRDDREHTARRNDGGFPSAHQRRKGPRHWCEQSPRVADCRGKRHQPRKRLDGILGG